MPRHGIDKNTIVVAGASQGGKLSIADATGLLWGRNAWKGDARIDVYDFNGHEGGQAFQQVRQTSFLTELWGE